MAQTAIDPWGFETIREPLLYSCDACGCDAFSNLESRAGAVAFRPRMFEYYIQLRRDTGLPAWPIALFLRVGLDGIGWDAYEEHFWERRVVRFEYAYVGLPGLEGEPFASGENLLGVALSALMRLPSERRAELYAPPRSGCKCCCTPRRIARSSPS